MSKNNLQSKLNELETIVEQFNDGDIDIDTALAQFEKGAALAESIEKDLSELKTKITVLKERFDQSKL